ncbi:hypothetical protein [Phaeobacter piscinae]|uniref:hypothetical protein n=1 Tax=Phaeobacter piscinae TaxID=1580596 RepID=UPI001FD1C1EC|nr:hypothetical protein [Phaeobacter piscinae]
MDLKLVVFLLVIPAHHNRVDQRVKLVSRRTCHRLIRKRSCEIRHVGFVKSGQVVRQVDWSGNEGLPFGPQCLQLGIHRIQPLDQRV